MTKHNAEMESNKEQSRVCVRLPLQIQLFAEEPGEAGADTDTAGLCDCCYGEKSSRCILVLAKRSFPLPG